MTHAHTFLLAIVFATATVVAGCDSQTSRTATDNAAPAKHDHAGDDNDGGQTDMDKMTAELAKLSPEDRTSAEKQHVCPVSGEMLGTMGAPLKVDVNGRQVWICCESCKEPLLNDPGQYLAKLPEK